MLFVRRSILLLITCIAIACSSKTDQSKDIVLAKDTTIFLFDIKQYSRSELATFIERINEFEPSVIAIHAVFPSQKSFREDSAFQQAIVHSGRVVLCTNINNDDQIMVHSIPFFVQSALDEGVNSVVIDEDGGARKYRPLYQGRDEGLISFPDKIAYHYNPHVIDDFERFRINESIPINYAKTLNDFHVLDIGSLSSYKIRGKIVLLTDISTTGVHELIPNAEGNLMSVPAGLIIANIVLRRLNSIK